MLAGIAKQCERVIRPDCCESVVLTLMVVDRNERTGDLAGFSRDRRSGDRTARLRNAGDSAGGRSATTCRSGRRFGNDACSSDRSTGKVPGPASEEAFSFSLDAAAQESGAESLQKLLRDGPAVGVFTISHLLISRSVTRWLPVLRDTICNNACWPHQRSDSSNLIDSPDAASLSAVLRMMYYDDADGALRKSESATCRTKRTSNVTRHRSRRRDHRSETQAEPSSV